MQSDVEQLEHDLVQAYYEGVVFRRLVHRVVRLAQVLARLDDDHPAQHRYRAAARALWGGDPGDRIDVDAVARALYGSGGASFLTAWVSTANQQGIRRQAA